MRFVRGSWDALNKFVRHDENLMGFLGKTFGCESAGDAHLFIICARPGEVFAGVKGGALFCALDKSREWVIIVDERGRCDRRLTPFKWKILGAISARKNRHRPGWRFLLLSFCIRIEIE